MLPRELQRDELEESREFRESRQGRYNDMMDRDRPYQVKSKRPPSKTQFEERPKPMKSKNYDSDLEMSRPMEYRK